MDTTLSISQKSIKLSAAGIPLNDPVEAPVNDRLARLPGYQASVISSLNILLVGAGGLGSEIGHGLVRNGIGHITICDPDIVELSNLNRQRFFVEDLYQNKAIRLVRNLHKEAVMPLLIEGYAESVERIIENNVILNVDAIICGVDNQKTRVFMSKWALQHHIPVIFSAVNNTADFGYVFIQTSKNGDPCFCCVFPDAILEQGSNPCTVGSSIDILKTIAGLLLYGLGALFLKSRPLMWSYKEISLSGMSTDGIREISRRPNCPICSNEQRF